MRRLVGLCAAAALVAACQSPPRTASPPARGSTPASEEELIAQIRTDAARSDQETDSKIRESLAEDAARDGEACIAQAPQSAGCLYYRALAQGLEARAHPARAGELLKGMIAGLDRADAIDASFDEGGPSRVRALVLIRAPGWPLGPGDADAGLIAARRAVELRPNYPPNLLALGEALTKTGDAAAARERYQQARDRSQALPESVDRDAWLRESEQALRRP